jgi:hypothetical protein
MTDPQLGQMTVSLDRDLEGERDGESDEEPGPADGLGESDDSTSIAPLSRVVFLAVLLLAVLTDAVDLEGVAGGEVVMLVSDGALDLSHLRREELDRGATLGANHVVMTAPVVLMFEAGNAVVEGDFTGEAATGEKFKRAVDGGETDARVFLLDQAMKFVGGKVLAGFEKGAQDGVALPSLLQAHATQMLQKNPLGFAQALARDRGLIVNAFL